MKLISVIVPVYKSSDFLDECITSLINQTYKNLEIILVDDGSPDECPEMCDEWTKKDNRIKVIHQENSGVSVARNVGIDNCKGEYISFVDSDDYIDKNTYEVLYSHILKSKADIVCMGHTNIDANGKKINRNVLKSTELNFNKVYSGEEFSALMFEDLSIAVVWDKIYSREVINSNRFKADVLSEEMVFFMEILTPESKAIYIQNDLYFYRKSEGSITAGFNEKFYLDRVNNIFSASKIAIEKFPNIIKSCKSAQIKTVASFLALMPYNYIKEKRKSYNDVLKKLYENKNNLNNVSLDLSIKIFIYTFFISKHFAKFIMGVYKFIFAKKL